MIFYIFGIALIVAMVWVTSIPLSTLRRALTAVTPCSDASDRAALDDLWPKLGGGRISCYLDVWISHNYTMEYWQPRIACQQDLIDQLREWNKTVKDPCLRSGHEHWLTFYQRELDSAIDELHTQKQKKEMDAYDANWAAEAKAAADYKADHPSEPPPNICIRSWSGYLCRPH